MCLMQSIIKEFFWTVTSANDDDIKQNFVRFEKDFSNT